ncbi:MAG: hypothetical protein JWO19_5462 [Bryobacterales bacterium]|nr:hypothetical protein [Bryobacterales bacterium]
MKHLIPVILWVSLAVAQKPPVPKTADGKPDLSGIWQGGGAAGLSFAIGVDNAKAARPDAATTQGAAREPAPYQDWVQPRLKEIRDRRSIDDPSGRCLLVGVPRITSMPLPIKIVQTKDEVIFLYETFHAFRVIPTDGRGHPDDIDPSFMGDSVGHWEGDTLVVDVVGFNDKTWLSNGASIHSDALHVVEQYRRVDYDTITYDVLIEDPKVFTKKWNLPSSFLSLRPGERLREYECIADNQDIQRFEELLKNPTLFVRPAQ